MPTMPGDRSDVDDGADGLVMLVRGEQQRQKRARDQVDGAHIHVHQAVEVFGLGGFDGAHVADAGIVDENVEAVELSERRHGRWTQGW